MHHVEEWSGGNVVDPQRAERRTLESLLGLRAYQKLLWGTTE
jgi:hypothetical protein